MLQLDERGWRIAFAAALMAVCACAVADGRHDDAAPRRARPPDFSDEVRSAFVEDFRELLDGPRPTQSGAIESSSVNESRGGTQLQWSRLVDGEALTTEIKRSVNLMSPALATPGRFKSGGHQICRREFGLLATLLGVASQFDDETRFRGDAASVRDALAAASAACKKGDDDVFAMARAQKGQLDDLLRGQSLSAEKGAGQFQWSDLADRALLMQRMETALEDRIGASLAEMRTFRRNRHGVRHEAQVLALLAEVVSRQDYEFWDDPTYSELAAKLRDASQSLAQAAENSDLAAARSAAALATKSCVDCHEGYR